MKLLVFTLILLGIAGAAQAVRFDWTLGESAIIEDVTTTSTDDDTRYDWVQGQPAILLDATFVASTPDTSTAVSGTEVNINGGVEINGAVTFN